HYVHKKHYDFSTEQGKYRFAVFKDNLNYIKSENAKQNSYKLGITPFADLTNEEYQKTVLLGRNEFREQKIRFLEEIESESMITNFESPISNEGIEKIDWSKEVIPAKNQGS